MNAVRVLLTLIPFIWSIGLLPFANRVKPLVMGLPFLAFWLVAGIIIAFLCIKVLYTFDSKNNEENDA